VDNPYKTPHALIEDLTYQPVPTALKKLYWLMSIAFLCSFVSTTIGFVNAFREATWVFVLPWIDKLMLVGLVGSAYGLMFGFYYFLVFRPLHLRRQATSKWWLVAVLILALLWFWFSLLPGESVNDEISLLDVGLGVAEIGCLMLGGLLASRRSSLEYLSS